MMKKIILLFLIISSFFLVTDVTYASDTNFEFTSYHIDIDVHDNNVFEIEETISVVFTKKSHGIYRYVPEVLKVQYNGETKKIYAHVLDIKVLNEEYTTEKSGSHLNIIIGDEDKYVLGHHVYKIRYKYDLSKDKFKNEDLFYFNIVGSGWNTPINNLTFNINMPKEFEDNIEFDRPVNYQIVDNTISGSISFLEENTPLTILLKLEDGYFANATDYKLRENLLILFSIIISVAIAITWLKVGKDRKVIEVVNFDPPENLNVARMGYYYNFSYSDDNLILLAFNLANEGYIDIIDEKNDKEEIKEIKFKKLKDYDGNDKELSTFFDGLFKSGDLVEISSLKEKFYTSLQEIKANLAKDNKKIIEKKSVGASVFFFLLTMGMVVWLIINVVDYYYKAVPFVIPCILISVFFTIIMRKRTKYGARILGEIRGFKNFIKMAKEDELKARLEKNDRYFYDILPYACLFGCEQNWIEKFTNLSIGTPSWGNGLTPLYYSHLYTHYRNHSAKDMISVPAGKSGGSGGNFGGGGFSGGGFGGGGGGSW